jgi:DNA-binding response OmpR family regulator
VSPKILVIDDDSGLRTLLKLGLEREGFVVITAENGREGLRKAYQMRPEAIVLDVMMAEMDGWTTCQRLRQICDTPIIMLTARGGKDEVIKGLSLGADDYVIKPCDFNELKARILTLLRRKAGDPQGNPESVYDDGNLRVDLQDGIVIRGQERFELTPTESRLLTHLVHHKGRVIPHRELLVSVWGPEYAEEVRYLSVYVRYLRQKIEEDPNHPRYIRTRWKLGYYFVDREAS